MAFFKTLRMVYNILRERETANPEEPIKISLDELCQLWLPYNSSLRRPEPKPSASEEASTPFFSGAPSGDPDIEMKGTKPTPVTAVDPVENSPIDTEVAARRRVQLSRFYEEVIQPTIKIMDNPNITAAINKVLDMLDQYGGCPSVVADDIEDSNSQYAALLQQVTVRQHTLRVTSLAVRLTGEAYKDSSGMKTIIIIAGLCHDLGKIPEIRNNPLYQAGRTTEHEKISVKVVDSLFADATNDHLLNMVKTIIGNHHLPTNDQLTLILKKADHDTRQVEIVERSANLKAPQWDTWFDTRVFLERIGKHVNVIQTGDMWRAFSVQDVVYCYPQFLYEEASKMAIDNNVVAVSLMQKHDTGFGLARIVDSLRKNGFLADELGRTFTSRRYAINMEHLGTRKMNLIPIKLNAFANPDAIKLLKDTYPQIVKAIKAC